MGLASTDFSSAHWEVPCSPLTVRYLAPMRSVDQQPRSWPTAIDLFCGCGGVTAALKARHFRVLAAVDCDPVACASYRNNHKSVHLYQADIKEISPQMLRDKHLGGKDLDLLVVCSPCQPFSQQNRKQTTDDRSELILTAVDFAKVLAPSLIFFENVPGLTRSKFSEIMLGLRSGLEREGYIVGDPRTVDTADYGVPQRRLRCVMLAAKGKEPPQLPSPTTPQGRRRTVRHAIGSLPSLTSGSAAPDDRLHKARNHQIIALRRLELIPKDGGSRSSLPEDLWLECHRTHDGHPDVYGRMKWDDVAPTLTTGCTDVTRGRFAHPRDDRAITLREAARLQTFPDSYEFAGSDRHIAVQLGNAVPVEFIRTIAPVLRPTIQQGEHGRRDAIVQPRTKVNSDGTI